MRIGQSGKLDEKGEGDVSDMLHIRSLKLTQMYAIDANPAFLSATMSCTIEELSGELSSSGCTVMRDGDQRIVFPEPGHRSTAVAACDRLQWENGFQTEVKEDWSNALNLS